MITPKLRIVSVMCVNFLVRIAVSSSIQDNIVALINSVIKSEQEPTNFFIRNCWSIHNKIEFMKNTRVQATFIDDFLYKLPIDLSPNHVMFVVDLDCEWAKDLMDEIHVNQSFFSHPYRWLMHGSNASHENLIIKINNALPDNNIIVADWKKYANTFELFQFYKTEPLTETIYEPFGYWSTGTALIDLRKTHILSRRRRNLRGKLIRGSVVTDYRDKTIDAVTRVSYNIGNYVLDTMNASKNFIFANTWGYLNKTTNKINGMLGDIVYGKVEIGGTSCFLLVERVGIVEYISMVSPSTVRFIFRAPPLSFVTNIHYLPFDIVVWISLICLVIISCFVIYVTNQVSNNRVRISDMVLFGIATVCQMGTHNQPKYLSGKLSTIFFVIALMFIYTSYTANIVSLLQSTSKSIKTLEDLLNSDFELGVEDNPYNRYYFRAARPGTVHRAIYEQKIALPKEEMRFMNLTYGISRLRNGFFAFHSETGTSYKVIEKTFYEHEKCGLTEIDYLSEIEPWFIIQKHLPYKEIMKVLLFKIREHGIQFREASRSYAKKPVCSSHGHNFESVRLIDCRIGLLILAYGFLFSFIIFIIEKIIHSISVTNKLCLH